MEIKDLYDIFINKCGGKISTDTRKILKDSLFFAWKGEYNDGNKYVEEALNLGCNYAIVDDSKLVLGDRYILVKDSKETLARLSNYHRNRFDIPIIAITGSNGKTTTKELVSSVLKTEKKVIFPDKSLNNYIGVSKTILRISNETDIVVIEMGANHIGEIKELCNVVEPTHGIITNIGRAHIGLFGSFDNIIKTKVELYEYLSNKKGIVFVNGADNLLLDKVKNLNLNKILYLSKDSDYYIYSKNTTPFISFVWNDNLINTNLTGEYNIYNISVAIAVGDYFGIKKDNILNGIGKYVPINSRSEIFESENNNLVIKDYYNANRSSMELSLNNLSKMNFKNKIAILGDMAELGEFSEEDHSFILNKAINLGTDKIFLLGSIFSGLNVSSDNVFQYKDINKLINDLNNLKISNSAILLKSSRGPNPIPAFQKIFDNVDW